MPSQEVDQGCEIQTLGEKVKLRRVIEVDTLVYHLRAGG